ncbi:alpha/beta hydrolase [Tianweitania sp. BSSL-BM11]|uniref:Alpha/beta hydrolase n=1 Tax=Tianweitania aestuarii TaxID=2814886 RepID=A0ABS5RUU7_9HYPH|nr:alpha/beta hydrolase [Tianweitania aestuarii]MBS9720835.1 alpha/beta hydrolase [Tianweitania aestuarii]
MPFIQTADETELFYNDWGTGKPVILIHGWPLDGDMWEYQWPTLTAKGHRVITYDRRGFGRSSQPFSGYDYDTLASDLQTIIETLDLHDVSLVGFSMGGGEVARYIGKYGTARLSKAALISAVTPYLLKTADNPDGVDKSVFDDMVEQLRKDRPAFLASFGKQFFGAGMLNFSVSAEIMQWASNVAMMGSPKGTIDCVRAFSETDFRADLAKFDLPTLIIHGEDDATVPIKAAGEQAAKLIPSATFKRYSGAPHGLFFTDKDKLTADLLAFL